MQAALPLVLMGWSDANNLILLSIACCCCCLLMLQVATLFDDNGIDVRFINSNVQGNSIK
jgi:hypothetical protein